jgi:hypothetical protein
MPKINWSEYWSSFLLIALLIVFIFWCNFDKGQQARMLHILDVQDYKEAQLTNYSFLGCAGDDFQRRGFNAEFNNNYVQGYICGGILKGYTVRLR